MLVGQDEKHLGAVVVLNTEVRNGGKIKAVFLVHGLTLA